LGYRPSYFEKDFLSALLHSPLSGRHFGPSIGIRAWLWITPPLTGFVIHRAMEKRALLLATLVCAL
jgi:hypothetical protein